MWMSYASLYVLIRLLAGLVDVWRVLSAVAHPDGWGAQYPCQWTP